MEVHNHCGLELLGPASDAMQELQRLYAEADVSFTYKPTSAVPNLKLIANKGQQEIEINAEISTLRAASHEECSTPVLQIGSDVTEFVKAGRSFRMARLAALPERTWYPSENPPKQYRDLGSLSGVVAIGTSNCPLTLMAVKQLSQSNMGFYYIDVTNSIGITHEALRDILSNKYEFVGTYPENNFHSTVPIVLINGKLLGGATELYAALRENNTRKKLEDAARRENDGVCFIPLGLSPNKAKIIFDKALLRGHAIRAVYAVKG
jgi:glutaredoxin